VDTGGEERRGVLTHSGQRRERTGHTQETEDRTHTDERRQRTGHTDRRGEALTHRHTTVGGHVVNSTSTRET